MTPLYLDRRRATKCLQHDAAVHRRRLLARPGFLAIALITRNAKNFIAAIYHGCARLPLPVER